MVNKEIKRIALNSISVSSLPYGSQMKSTHFAMITPVNINNSMLTLSLEGADVINFRCISEEEKKKSNHILLLFSKASEILSKSFFGVMIVGFPIQLKYS